MHGSSGAGRWLLVMAAVLLGSLVAWGSPGRIVGASCVWASGGDAALVERFLREWLAASHGPALTSWNASVDPATAQIDLQTPPGEYQIELVLGSTCWTPPHARLVHGPSGLAFPSAGDLAVLAAEVPVPKHGASLLEAREAALIFVLACLGLGVAALLPMRTRWSAVAAHATWVLPMVVLAAWPILFAPFDTDAPAQRAAFAAADVFGDWNHPFLPYLFNRPTTWFSLEPWALRLVPLVFLCGETVLMMTAAARDGGPLAGAFAGIWFVCEIRRRHGLYDLSDWDVAGTFLMALVLVVQDRTRIGWHDAAVIAALMVSAVMSSWLTVVACGVLVGCLGIDTVRGGSAAGPTIAVGGVFALLALLAFGVFATGSAMSELFPAEEIGRQMIAETPVGRSAVMLVPLALAALWLIRNGNRPGPRFVGLTLLAVPAAVYIAQVRSHVNGGYYVGLVTPMLLYAAAVASARVIDAIARRVATIGASRETAFLASGTRCALALAVAIASVHGLGTGESGVGAEQLALLAHDTRADQWPIFTNAPSLLPLLAYERARDGEGLIADAIGPEADTLAPGVIRPNPWGLQSRIHLLDRGVCAPTPDPVGTGFYLVYLNSDDQQARRHCVEQVGSFCHQLTPPPPGRDRVNWVLRCDNPNEPSLR